MAGIPIGVRFERNLLVTSEVAIDFLGSEQARVLSTPHLIGFLEMACRDAVVGFLEPGCDTVGARVDVRHLAATPIGMSVTLRAEVIAVDGRRVTFKVEAFDEREKIAEGEHQRAVIDVARFVSRLQAKSAAL